MSDGMQSSNELVSIYIPTRDRIDLLRRAVKSCVVQDYPHLEIIISDDGSAAEHRQQLTELAALDPRIQIISSDTPQGACAARNKAIAAAKGYFITGLDDDDEFMPNRISCFIRSWQQTAGKAAFLCANSEVIITGGLRLKQKKRPQAITLNQLLHANIIGNQLFTKTEYLRAIGGFDEQLSARQDYETWLRLAERFGDGQRIPDVTYLVHQDHRYERISNSSRRIQGYDYVFSKHKHLMNDSQKQSHLFYRRLYTENPSLLPLLAKTPLRLWPVAIKVISLRMLGYKV
jgi:glycosyltransferase involved in cell wall biosynthesis